LPEPEEHSDLPGILSKVSIFAGLRHKQLEEIIKASKELSYKDGKVVAEAGNLGVAFFMVLEGKLEVRRKGKVLARLGKGDFFGEMALLNNQPRIADVVAVAPTKCLVLSAWSFSALVKDDPAIALALMKVMAKRLSDNEAAETR
jgi:CRP/FNR family transcriptional regulator, cyclic AMP receptor protein